MDNSFPATNKDHIQEHCHGNKSLLLKTGPEPLSLWGTVMCVIYHEAYVPMLAF
jgi:hypothetical protein